MGAARCEDLISAVCGAEEIEILCSRGTLVRGLPSLGIDNVGLWTVYHSSLYVTFALPFLDQILWDELVVPRPGGSRTWFENFLKNWTQAGIYIVLRKNLRR